MSVAEFEINHTAYIGADGSVVRTPPAEWVQPETLTDLYRWMVLTRTFDAKAVQLQRTGRLGTYASCLGQEAAAVGIAAAMRTDDVLVPSFREQGAQLHRGVSLLELFQYWGGDERGSDFQGPRQDFPTCVTVGGHAPHAAGVAMAFKLRAEPRVVLCVFGDGATSKGDVYEAMNMSGVWRLPVVFVVINNQWAISTPRTAQSAAQTLAQKALGAGFQGEQVDGNDVIAVASCVADAVDKARAGGGPHLIEALTYRLADHTTADDASRYRPDSEVTAQWQLDPLARLRKYLGENHGWTAADEEAVIKSSTERVEDAAQQYLSLPPQPLTAIFDYLYQTLPDAMAAQRATLVRQADSYDV